MDIQSTEEANAFLQQNKQQGGGRFDYFSSTLETVATIRKREKKKKKLTLREKSAIYIVYRGMTLLVRQSDRKVFREIVPEQEIAAWFDHVEEILQQKINDQHWIRTGTLRKHEIVLLTSYSAFTSHPLPALMAFENTKILEIISSMMISRRKASGFLPGEEFRYEFCLLIWGLVNSTMSYFDNTWEPEKCFKKLESIGILEQFLHCAAIPSATDLHPGTTKFLKGHVLQNLLRCTRLIKKRLRVGTPCGDTLRAILEKASVDPTAICSHTLPHFVSLGKLSTLLQIEDEVDCQFCKKRNSKNAYMLCSRCKQVHYCSKNCQRADWKEHKVECFVATNTVADTFPRLSRSVISEILEKNYFNIMIRLKSACDEAGGLEMKDMMLELDICPNRSGRIPLLQDPPQFEITPIAKYLDGTRLNELQSKRSWLEDFDWGKRDEKVEVRMTTLREKLSAWTESGLLTFEQHQSAKVYKSHQLFTEDTKQPMFTQEALDAFRIAINDNDYTHLSSIFESEEFCMLQMRKALEEIHESYKRQIQELKDAKSLLGLKLQNRGTAVGDEHNDSKSIHGKVRQSDTHIAAL